MSILRRFQPFPLLFAYAWIVGIFALGSSPLVHLWRPLLLALTAVVIVMVLGFLIGRGSVKVQLVAGLIAMLLVAAWPFVAGLSVVLAWRYAIEALRGREGRSALREGAPTFVVRMANGAGLVIAVVATANVILAGGLDLSTAPSRDDRPVPAADLPNIHLVLLDGYPRADTLMSDFEYDNSSFVASLQRQGFDVVQQSRSNYTKSIMTLASMLNMDYVQAIPMLASPDESAVVQARQLTRAINNGRALDLLRDRGYEIVASGAAFGEASLMSADVFMEAAGLTKFEEQIARFTWLASVLDVVAPEFLPVQHRDSVRQSFKNWLAVAEAPPGRRPYFLLTHVLAPHSPFLFQSDGSDRLPPDCFPTRCALWDTTELLESGMTVAEYSDGLHAQMDYINERVLETLSRVRAADPEAVIVIFSDHGMRYDADEPDEFFRNLIAVDLPGADENLPEDASLVNVLPYVFNAVLDMDLPIRPYEGWLSSEKPFDVTRFEPAS